MTSGYYVIRKLNNLITAKYTETKLYDDYNSTMAKDAESSVNYQLS